MNLASSLRGRFFQDFRLELKRIVLAGSQPHFKFVLPPYKHTLMPSACKRSSQLLLQPVWLRHSRMLPYGDSTMAGLFCFTLRYSWSFERFLPKELTTFHPVIATTLSSVRMDPSLLLRPSLVYSIWLHQLLSRYYSLYVLLLFRQSQKHHNDFIYESSTYYIQQSFLCSILSSLTKMSDHKWNIFD